MEKDVEEPESLMDLICNGRGLGIAGVRSLHQAGFSL